MNRKTGRMQSVEATPTVVPAVLASEIASNERRVTDARSLDRSQCQTVPAAQHRTRKRRTWEDAFRSLDAPWFGEEPFFLGMKVFTEEELAQHAKVSVEQVRMWITQHGLTTLPTPDGSVRIAEWVFVDWAQNYPGFFTGTHKLTVGAVCSHPRNALMCSSPPIAGNKDQPEFIGLPDDELMIVKMNRFWKRSEVASAWNLPEDLKWIVKDVPTAHVCDGEEYVKGHDVDRVIDNCVPSARPDGPCPPDTMRVAGKDYHCGSGLRWRLLQSLWNKGAVTVEYVIEEVWSHDAGDREKSLDSLVKHARRWLRSSKCPLAIRIKDGYVELLFTGGNKGPEGSMSNPR